MTDVERRFDGKVVAVTGAASGMGESSARLFAAAGARLALIDRDGDGLARVVRDMPSASTYVGSVADAAFC